MLDSLVDLVGVPRERRTQLLAVGTLRDTAEYDGNKQCHRQPDRYAYQNPGHILFVALWPVN